MSMLFTDMNYRDYFHKFLVFEVDNLTDDLKDVLDINEDDCFIFQKNNEDKRIKEIQLNPHYFKV